MTVWFSESSVKYILTEGTPYFRDTEVQLWRSFTPKPMKICWNRFWTWNYSILTYRNKEKIRPSLKLLILEVPDPKDHNWTQFPDTEPYLSLEWKGQNFSCICYLFHPLGSLLAKFGFAAVISLIPVANNVKSDDFYLWPDIDPTCDLFMFFLFPQKVLVESYQLPHRLPCYSHWLVS